MPAIVLRSDWDGARVRAAARAGAMDRQRLREWVHRFNAGGPAGMVDHKAPGATAKLSPAQAADLAALIDAGPEAERDGVVRWRCGDLQTLIQDRWGVSYPENSVGRLLKRLGCRRLSACPRHLGQDPAAIEAVTKDVPTDWPRLSPHAPPARQ